MNVSVVIPLYNKRSHIRRAIDSVLGQSHQDFEIVVVDDGSTDGGADIVRAIGDPRIRLIRQNNSGVSVARNRGVEDSSHPVVAFLDADDEWLPEFLARALSMRERFPSAGLLATAYCYGDGTRRWDPAFAIPAMPPGGGVLGNYFLCALGAPPVWSSAVVIPRGIFEEAGGFPPGVARGEDLCLWSTIALRHPVAWHPEPSAIYHQSAENRACLIPSTNRDLPGAAQIEQASPGSALSPEILASARDYLDFWRLRLAWNWLLQGKKEVARDLLEKTASTGRFRRRHALLHLLAHVPAGLLRHLHSLKTGTRLAAAVES